MTFKPESPYVSYPAKWSVWDTHAGVASWPAFGFSGKTGPGDVNRFGARYRLAKSFRGITVEGYKSNETIEGYNGLLRVFLMWSAVEQFEYIVGVSQKELGNLVEKYEPETCVKKVKACDTENRFFEFVYKRANQTHQEELDDYLAGKPCNITHLASSIRHIFAHGPLTPNAKDTPPEVVKKICDLLFDFHMSAMDQEFEQKMDDFEKIRLS